jgi:hypothetical protein
VVQGRAGHQQRSWGARGDICAVAAVSHPEEVRQTHNLNQTPGSTCCATAEGFPLLTG